MSDEPRARLNIEIFVDCPKCKYMIDLMRPEDSNGYNHNHEGQLVEQACPNDGETHWRDAREEFECDEIECSKCNHKFNVRGLDW